MYPKEDFCCQNISSSISEEIEDSGRKLKVEVGNGRFRVLTREFCTDWFADTSSNRKAVLIFLRLLKDKKGKRLYTYQELSAIVNSENRQASSNHMEHFCESKEDMLIFLTRRRKVDEEIVSAVMSELLKEPLIQASKLCELVNKRFGRDDLSEQNIHAALNQISYEPIRRVLLEQLLRGKVHYKEEYLLKEMLENFSVQPGKQSGIVVGGSEGMVVSDPTAIRKLLTAGADLFSIKRPIQLVCFLIALYYNRVPLSVLGRWCYVHKTTVLRWIVGLCLELWPIVFEWIQKQVKAKSVYTDEKWLKIRGKWYYWFVVLEEKTGLPIVTSLLESRGEWACRWIGYLLKKLGQLPEVIITDGMVGYEYLKEVLGKNVRHLLCHFHHQQSTTRFRQRTL